MTREEKDQQITELTTKLTDSRVVYLADISAMTVEQSNKLRRAAFNKQVSVNVVKNTLLKKAMEKTDKDLEGMYDVLKGNTSIMIAEVANAPAKLIEEFRKKNDKPILKAALIDNDVYVGDEHVKQLAALKSKEELVGDIIMLLQSPAKRVISQLQSGGSTLSGLLKSLAENPVSNAKPAEVKEETPKADAASEAKVNEDKADEAVAEAAKEETPTDEVVPSKEDSDADANATEEETKD